jgi:hypothetical protein
MLADLPTLPALVRCAHRERDWIIPRLLSAITSTVSGSISKSTGPAEKLCGIGVAARVVAVL